MKKNLLFLMLVGLMLVASVSTNAQNGFDWPYKVVNGTIVTDVPQRPAGQGTALNLTTPKLPIVRVGFVGLGMRGPDAVRRWTYIRGTEVVALCDHERERAEACNKILKEASMPAAAVYAGEEGYKELCERKDIDLVYIATDWMHHFTVAKYAMEHGKHVAIEVPAAMNLNEIWQLINTSERTRKHCMQLENCVYDFFELTSLNMAQQGLFGDIVHVEGSYIHNLEEFWPYYYENWRMDYNRSHKGDIYATHDVRMIVLHAGKAVGMVDVFNFDALNSRAEVGVFVDKAHRRSGLGEVALRIAVENYAFGRLNLNQVYCTIRRSNEAALALFRQAGFTGETVLAQWISAGNGVFEDAVIMQRFSNRSPHPSL